MGLYSTRKQGDAMSYTIEMTPRGVLLAGGFRTEEELNRMRNEDKRNTMIVELAGHTNQPVPYFQGFKDDVLVGMLAVAVFLEKAGIRNLADLKTLSNDDQRNTLIVANEGYTDRSIPELQGKSNQELVQIGLEWFAKSRAIAAILEFYWNVDQSKIIGTTPEVLQVQSYDNRQSNTELDAEFSFTKSVVNSSSFSHEHGFEITAGVKTTFKAGIPALAENETTVSLSASTSHNWSFGEENSTEQSYTHSSTVKVPPHGHIQRTASVTKGTMTVPYRAKIRAGDGSLRWLEGTWNGVSTVNCVAKQIDL
jgi:hypothetical protein